MGSCFPNLSPQAGHHLDAFISSFVQKHRRGRWRTMMALEPDRWSAVSAYDCAERESADWNTPVSVTISRLGLELFLDHEAFIFTVGHGAGVGFYEGTLRQALMEKCELECVVSIRPGELAICYGHSNEFRLCQRSSLVP